MRRILWNTLVIASMLLMVLTVTQWARPTTPVAAVFPAQATAAVAETAEAMDMKLG